MFSFTIFYLLRNNFLVQGGNANDLWLYDPGGSWRGVFCLTYS